MSPTKGSSMSLDPARRSLRMLAVIGALAALPLLAACNDSEEGDDDNDDDDGMGRPAAVLVVTQ
ncbi:hypothetical protein [Actinophytocola sp.]|uniref:hypothetical protein n=1 Tax=Actinophytocola sp. TaxID=1872138 RepID=UPI002ED42C38